MARSAKKASDTRLIELFLDMLAAERGAAKNTLEAYDRDLADFSAHLAARKRSIASGRSEDVRAYLTELALENGIIHITGFANDAPSLLVPLERSGFFSDVHFFAQTTRNTQSAQFVFHIQARVEPRLDLAGE